MNIAELKAEMARQKISIPELAKKMKVSKKLIYSRFNGLTPFNHNEISLIIEILSLDKDKMMIIFFADLVS